jgi:hypothetical protein
LLALISNFRNLLEFKMTNYLTKITDGKLFHFKAFVKYSGVNVIEGQWYVSLNKYFENCGTQEKAIIRQQELVNQKLKEGFQESEYEENLENTMDVYDKAKWHLNDSFPQALDEYQAYVHTGMFLGWLVDNNLVSEEFSVENEQEIMSFKNREITGAQLYENACDGVLTLEDLSERGNRFALYYFEFSKGLFPHDYDSTLCQDLPSIFHVEDSWDNYNLIKPVFDNRFKDYMEAWDRVLRGKS